MLRVIAFLGVAMLAAPAAAADEAATLFGTRERISHIDISPDGGSYVYLTPGPGAQTAVLAGKFAGGQPTAVLTSDGHSSRVQWCNFASNTRLVCDVRLLSEVQGNLLAFSRLISIDANGGEYKQLGQRASFYDAGIRQDDGRIIDWLPGDGAAVLMSRTYVPEVGKVNTRIVRDEQGTGIDRIDLRTLRATVVEPANKNADGFMSDGRGKVRMMWSYAAGNTGQLRGSIDYYYRRAGSSDWERFGTYNIESSEGVYPVAVDAGLNAAYVLKELNGRDALYRVKLDGSMAAELVLSNPRVDVDNVVRINRGGRVIGATFVEEQRDQVYFDPEYKALAGALSKAIPNLPLIQFAGSSADQSKLLVFAGSDSDPGRYYIYDKGNRSLNEIMLVRPAMEKARLASVKPVSYPARDGTMIPAYLTLPPGGTGKNLPAIVLPHGGPQARDEWGFDWLSQYLANQGYAVIQPNYRGSAGYGEDWLVQNGFRSWRTSIGDVTAAARWLTTQGIGDPDRLAIVGWSYGGYAALQAGVVEPGLFKAIVAIAPVTDLAQLKEDARGFTNARLVANYIGSGPHVAAGSPLANAERIAAPVLMFHGDQDINVDVNHARRMDAALRKEGKKSELVIYQDLEHDLADSTVRAEMLEKIDGFLGSAVGN